MGFRMNKRIKVGKRTNLNVGKRGASTSIKVGNTTFSSRGRITTTIPGTGVSYTTNLNKRDARGKKTTHFTDYSGSKLIEQRGVKKFGRSYLIGAKLNIALSYIIGAIGVLFLFASIDIGLPMELAIFLLIVATGMNFMGRKFVKQYKQQSIEN